LSVGGEACMWSIDCFVSISTVLVIHFFYELKHIIEILHQGWNFKCSFEDSVAVGGNLLWLNELGRPVMRTLRWRTQVRYMKKAYLCHQQMTVDSYFYIVHYDLCVTNFLLAWLLLYIPVALVQLYMLVIFVIEVWDQTTTGDPTNVHNVYISHIRRFPFEEVLVPCSTGRLLMQETLFQNYVFIILVICFRVVYGPSHCILPFVLWSSFQQLYMKFYLCLLLSNIHFNIKLWVELQYSNDSHLASYTIQEKELVLKF
jgi:hypothetical protein